MTVIAPCDSARSRKAVIAAADIDGPVYFRFGREAIAGDHRRTDPFTIGKARWVRQGTDCAAVLPAAHGPMRRWWQRRS